MKALYDAWLIQIEVTNVCGHACAYCSRGIRHVAAPSFADLAFVESALQSLEGWRKGVGCTGGEPTLHPRFADICELYQAYFPRHQCGLWTSGGPGYRKHRSLIQQTFGLINYNDHYTPCFHQPILVAAGEVIDDDRLREELIDRCWVQLHWSPIITPKGAFFCEIAATLDLILAEPGGYPLRAGWWDKDVPQFADQRDRYCRRCGIPLPLENQPDTQKREMVSPLNAADLVRVKSPLALAGRLEVIDTVYSREQIEELRRNQQRDPREYARPDPAHFWVKTPMRAWFWKAAKYRHIPHGKVRFLVDTARFLGLKFHDALVSRAR